MTTLTRDSTSSALGEPALQESLQSFGENGPATEEPLPVSIFLQPIAAPTVLGYFAAASAFLLFGVWLGGAIGGNSAGTMLFPFLLLFGGIGQLAAGMWSVRGRDAVGASLFSAWGGFWIGYGFMWLAALLGTFTLPSFGAGFGPLGQVLIYMAVITWACSLAALGRSPFEFLSQAIAAAAATIAAAALIAGAGVWLQVAGWAFVAASALFYYHGAATIVNGLCGRVVLPHLSWRREENVLGARPLQPIQFKHGDPGVKVGQ